MKLQIKGTELVKITRSSYSSGGGQSLLMLDFIRRSILIIFKAIILSWMGGTLAWDGLY